MNEIEEFYSYVEMPQVAENLKAWHGSFPEGEFFKLVCYLQVEDANQACLCLVAVEWIKAPLSKRRTHVEVLLESLEHRDAEVRFTNARRLFYVLQGMYLAES